jgi:hypothetical protein
VAETRIALRGAAAVLELLCEAAEFRELVAVQARKAADMLAKRVCSDLDAEELDGRLCRRLHGPQCGRMPSSYTHVYCPPHAQQTSRSRRTQIQDVEKSSQPSPHRF